MSARKTMQEQRDAIRVPVRFPAKIRTQDFGQVFYGECTDLSVGGMTLITMYVPRPNEEFDVYLMPPRINDVPPQPFSARVRVVRCHEMDSDHRYELGLAIIKVIK